jgi:hypothetical protein
MAKQLKFISTDDIKDIPDKGVLTYLLHIAQVRLVKYCIYFVDLYTNLVVFWLLQQKKMYLNQSFIMHMTALDNEGVFHQGSFDINQIMKHTRLTKESAQVYVSIIFNVDSQVKRQNLLHVTDRLKVSHGCIGLPRCMR